MADADILSKISETRNQLAEAFAAQKSLSKKIAHLKIRLDTLVEVAGPSLQDSMRQSWLCHQQQQLHEHLGRVDITGKVQHLDPSEPNYDSRKVGDDKKKPTEAILDLLRCRGPLTSSVIFDLLENQVESAAQDQRSVIRQCLHQLRKREAVIEDPDGRYRIAGRPHMAVHDYITHLNSFEFRYGGLNSLTETMPDPSAEPALWQYDGDRWERTRQEKPR